VGRHCGSELGDGNWRFFEQQSPKAQDLAVTQGEGEDEEIARHLFRKALRSTDCPAHS